MGYGILQANRFPISTYSKLNRRKFGPFQIHKLREDTHLIDLSSDLPTFLVFNVSNLYIFYGDQLKPEEIPRLPFF